MATKQLLHGKVLTILLTALFAFHFSLLTSRAQTVRDLIRKYPSYASCNYHIYPEITATLTPPPGDKKPFYLSHYGRHGSRYINSRSGYDIPYKMMAQADSLDELTVFGEEVYAEMRRIMRDTENRWGELSGYGKRQLEAIGHRMAQRFPEIFCPGARVTAVSTVVPRCIESMGSAALQLLQVCPQLNITMESSQRNQWYMNYQDRKLRRNYMTPEAQKAYDAYTASRMGNSQLMELIFKNPDIVKEIVDEDYFNYYLMKMSLFQLNTSYNQDTHLIKLFSEDALYNMSLAICLVTLAVVYILLRSKIGLGLTAMRDNISAAASLGVDIGRTRFLVYLVSAVITAVAGAIFCINKGTIYPDSGFSIGWTISMVFICIIGGVGTIEGPVVGAIIYVLLQVLGFLEY